MHIRSLNTVAALQDRRVVIMEAQRLISDHGLIVRLRIADRPSMISLEKDTALDILSAQLKHVETELRELGVEL